MSRHGDDDEEPALLDEASLSPEGLRVTMLEDGLALLEYPIPEAELDVELSVRERDIALAIFEGLSNEEIAALHGVSVKTVANQIESLFRKVGVASRAELVLEMRKGPV